ncbi:MAG: hypothetical protein PHV17_01320 [Candidatus Omnitrophica bacterium]|nr:hypothetical protein [Candidatus Omnitrophota bacterium]
MSGSKLVPILFLILLLGVGAVAVVFNMQSRDKDKQIREKDDYIYELENTTEALKSDKRTAENKISALEQRNSQIQSELDRAQQEIEVTKRRYNEVSMERDQLMEKLRSQPQVEPTASVPVRREIISSSDSGDSGGSDEYWADFIRAKADLEVQLADLRKELIDANGVISGLDEKNKSLSIKIDGLTKDREKLTDEMKFKERSMSIMSRDLVVERESRKSAIEELKKLRSDNVSLKRELLVVNKDKMRLQNSLKDALEKKEKLQVRISEIDSVLREKSLTLEELQDDLNIAIKGGQRVAAQDKRSIELPPIVVKPEISGVRTLRAEVIAVNPQEKFVVVDLGESSGVRPGTNLRVVRGNKEIGTVEIIETRKDISAADIKEVVGGYTIQEGDIVISR